MAEPYVDRSSHSRSPRRPEHGAWRTTVGLCVFAALAMITIIAPWLVDHGGGWCTGHPQIVRWLPLGPQCLNAGQASVMRQNASFVGPIPPGPWWDNRTTGER